MVQSSVWVLYRQSMFKSNMTSLIIDCIFQLTHVQYCMIFGTGIYNYISHHTTGIHARSF